MSAFYRKLILYFLASILVYIGISAPARAEGPPRIVLVENTDFSGGAIRLHYPVLISNDRGYRIRCESQLDEDAVIRGLGFLTPPSDVLDPLSEVLIAADPQQNPLLCPNRESFKIKVFLHAGEGGDKFYFQFPEAIGSTSYTNKIYIPGCKGLADALAVDISTAIEADPTPFFGTNIFTIDCVSGIPLQTDPTTFVDWCTKGDLSAEERRTVDALLQATPEGSMALGNPIACQSAQTFLSSLPSLDLSGFELSDIGPIAALPNLTMLTLSKNQLAEIGPLKGLTNLQFVDLGDNQLSNIASLAALTQLKELDLSKNKVSNLRPLSSVIALQKLNLAGNQIADLAPLSHLLALTELRLAKNMIDGAAIEMLTGLSALTFLDLSDNQVDTLEFVGELPSNVTIRLEGNPVFGDQNTSFAEVCVLQRSDATPYGLTIREMVTATGATSCQDAATALSSNATLALTGKGIADVRPLALLGNLRNLDLSGNSIVDVKPLEMLADLRQLKLANNSIRDIVPIGKLVNLDALDLAGNPVDVSTYLPACLMRNHENALTEDQSIEVLALLNAAAKPTCLASKEHLERLTTLRIANAQLRSLDYFPVLQQVQTLELPDNQLTNVGVLSQLPSLTRLRVNRNQIPSFQSFTQLRRLSELNVASNPINSLNQIQSLATLTELNVQGTNIRVIRNLGSLPLLQRAHLWNVPIEYQGFEDYCLVEKFDSLTLGSSRAFVQAVAMIAAGQGIDTTNCQSFGDWAAALEILNLNKRDLTVIDPIRLFGSLKELYLFDNRIQDMSPVVNLTKLQTLVLGKNLVSDVPNLQSRNLKTLDLSQNHITNVFALGQISSLQSIDVSDNFFPDASPLKSLGQVTSLDLRNNQIRFMNQLAHWTLPKTYISGNPICQFPHESSAVVAACKRRPMVVVDVFDRFDDIVISPHVLVDPGVMIFQPITPP